MTDEEIAKVIVENVGPLVTVAQWLLVTIVAAFIAVVVWAWKLSAVFSGFKESMQSLETKADSLGKGVSAAENYLHALSGHFGSDAPQFNAYTQANSPITLTPSGENLVRDSGFYRFAEEHVTLWASIADAAKGRPDAQAYIEKNALQAVHQLFDDDDPRVAEVSLYMFEHGLRHDESQYEGILKAFGIVARDAAFRIAGIDVPIAPPASPQSESA